MSMMEGVKAFTRVSVPDLAVGSNISLWTVCIMSRVNTLRSPRMLSRPDLRLSKVVLARLLLCDREMCQSYAC